MLRHLLAILVTLGLAIAPAGLPPGQPGARPETAYFSYLPSVQIPALVQVVETARGEYIGYPGQVYIYGYVKDLTDRPLYHVVLELEVTVYPYGIPTPPPPYTETVRFSPALTATLPGQINPFSYSLMTAKTTYSFGWLRVAAASRTSPDGKAYAPLAIMDWRIEGTKVLGTVRNEGSKPVQAARVVIAALDKCAWREAVLDSPVLAPGQETAFENDFTTTYCFDQSLSVVGQGAVRP